MGTMYRAPTKKMKDGGVNPPLHGKRKEQRDSSLCKPTAPQERGGMKNRRLAPFGMTGSVGGSVGDGDRVGDNWVGVSDRAGRKAHRQECLCYRGQSGV
jgi:hypothetical protein